MKELLWRASQRYCCEWDFSCLHMKISWSVVLVNISFTMIYGQECKTRSLVGPTDPAFPWLTKLQRFLKLNLSLVKKKKNTTKQATWILKAFFLTLRWNLRWEERQQSPESHGNDTIWELTLGKTDIILTYRFTAKLHNVHWEVSPNSDTIMDLKIHISGWLLRKLTKSKLA